jgi:hypothetical protein
MIINKGKTKFKKGQELGIGLDWLANPVTLATHCNVFDIIADRNGTAMKVNKQDWGTTQWKSKREFNAELKRIKEEFSQQWMGSQWCALFDGKLEMLCIIDHTQPRGY